MFLKQNREQTFFIHNTPYFNLYNGKHEFFLQNTKHNQFIKQNLIYKKDIEYEFVFRYKKTFNIQKKVYNTNLLSDTISYTKHTKKI